jgi:hypothetical protein
LRRTHRAREQRALACRLSKLSDVLITVVRQWLAYLSVRHRKSLLRGQAAQFHNRGVYKSVVCIWRLIAFEARAACRQECTSLRTCLWSWCSWNCSRMLARQDASSRYMWLQRKTAVRRWTRWQRQCIAQSKMKVCAQSFDASSCLRAVTSAWFLAHCCVLRERRWLLRRAAWKHWRKYVKYCHAFKGAVEQAFICAMLRNNSRLRYACLCQWHSVMSWIVADRDSKARSVIERRCARQKLAKLRRQSVGPNGEELFTMQVGFASWHAFYASRVQIQQKAEQDCGRSNNAVLLLVLDRWVDTSLTKTRSENLRRRRHVRFSIGGNARAKQSPRSGHGACRSVVREIRGRVGQWAMASAAWEASACLLESLDAMPTCVDRATSSSHSHMKAVPNPKSRDSILQIGSLCFASGDDPHAIIVQSEPQLSLADTGSTISPVATDMTPLRHPCIEEPVVQGSRPETPDFPSVVSYHSIDAGKGGLPAHMPSSNMDIARADETRFQSMGIANQAVPSHLDAVLLHERRGSSPSTTRRNSPGLRQHEQENRRDILRFFKVRSCAGA